MSDLTLGDELVIGIINLLGALVNFSMEQAMTEKNYAVHDVVPSLDQQFAEQSHGDNGIHILKCAIHHAVEDPMIPSLLSSNRRVCKYNDEVVLVVSSGVHTSMKGIDYDLTISVTEKNLIAAYCECKSSDVEFFWKAWTMFAFQANFMYKAVVKSRYRYYTHAMY